MTIDEFKQFQGEYARPINPDEYKVVEFIYTYHPCNFSKDAVASIYNECGIIIFYDMFYTAKKACNAEQEVQQARRKFHEAVDHYKKCSEVNLEGLLEAMRTTEEQTGLY